MMRRNLQSRRGASVVERSISNESKIGSLCRAPDEGDSDGNLRAMGQQSADSSRPTAVPKLKLNVQSTSNAAAVPKLRLNVQSTSNGRNVSSSSTELAPLVPPITPRDGPDPGRLTTSHNAPPVSVVEWFDDFDFSSLRTSEAYVLSADSHDADATEEGSLRDIVSMDSMSSWIGDDSSDASPRGSAEDPLPDDSYEPQLAYDTDSTPFLHRSTDFPLRALRIAT